jgi:hypothetical protein
MPAYSAVKPALSSAEGARHRNCDVGLFQAGVVIASDELNACKPMLGQTFEKLAPVHFCFAERNENTPTSLKLLAGARAARGSGTTDVLR